MSDVYLTEHCGILKNLVPGDVVLADHGFTIAESVATMHAKLHIAALLRESPTFLLLKLKIQGKLLRPLIVDSLLRGIARIFLKGVRNLSEMS